MGLEMSRRMRFIVFFTIVLAIWAVEHLYVGWRLSSLPLFEGVSARRWLVVFLVAGFASYPAGRIAFHHGWHRFGTALEYGGGVWMGTLMLLLFAFLAVDVVTLFGFALKPWLATLRSGATGTVRVTTVPC